MNFFALHQGERGVPGVPGDAGEKGEPGIGITGPPVCTCLRVTSQTLSSFKGIVHTKQKIVIYSLSCCSKLSFVEHKSWNFSLLHIQKYHKASNVYKSNEQLLWYFLSELELDNGFILFQWVIQVCNDNDFSHRTTQSALSFLHPTYFPQKTTKFTLYKSFPSSFRF